ncbi:unnamed protein product [Diamesa tonsa]
MDDDQQFCLRWNNHQSTLISVFDTLLENGTLVDCTLAAEGKFLKAHKVVLSACSPYFAALLSQQYDKHPIFILKDVKFQELRAMMDYMYRGEVNISQDQLAALLKAAESLQIKGLSDSRGGGNGTTNNTNSTNMPSSSIKSDGKSSHASGLTIENKRPLLRTIGSEFDADNSGSREGSVSPSTRKRKKVNLRRKSFIESNSLLDNHDQHSNSSSHSNNLQQQQQQQQQLSINTTNTSATSATSNSMSVTKKTDHQSDNAKSTNQHQEHPTDDDTGDEDNEPEQRTHHIAKRTKHEEMLQNSSQESELLIEPKNEYDDDDDNDGNVEDLTMDDEELLEDLEQAGPSHGGEGSSQGYHWQMDGRSQDEALMAQEAGQHRDAQEDLSITKIAGLTWDQWNARLAMPLVTTLREGAHPLVFPHAFTCPDCGRMYKLKSSLRNHQKWECGKEPQFQCPYCVYRAKQKMHIGRHMERMHKEKFFKVDPDGKVIALDEALNQIVQATGFPNPLSPLSMTPIPPSIGGAYSCSRCGNSYARPHSLNRHIRFECGVEPKFECPVCHKKSKHKHNLTLPAVKVSLVKCDNSKMKVLNNSSSSQGPPIAITNSANGSQCPYCRRIYADADAVTRHIKKYCLKEKRFGCIFCQYRSKRKDHIVRHTIRVHDAQLPMKHVMMTEDLMAPPIRCSTGKMTDLFGKYSMHQQQPAKHQVSITKQSKILPQFAPQSSSSGCVVGNNLERRPTVANSQTNSVPTPTLVSFKCLFCSLFFRTQAFLNEHMRKEHSVLI